MVQACVHTKRPVRNERLDINLKTGEIHHIPWTKETTQNVFQRNKQKKGVMDWPQRPEHTWTNAKSALSSWRKLEFHTCCQSRIKTEACAKSKGPTILFTRTQLRCISAQKLKLPTHRTINKVEGCGTAKAVAAAAVEAGGSSTSLSLKVQLESNVFLYS